MLYKKITLCIALVICPLSLYAMDPELGPNKNQESVQEKKTHTKFRAWKLLADKIATQPTTKITRSISVPLPIRDKEEKEIQKSNSVPEPLPTSVTQSQKPKQQEIELDSNGFIKNPLRHEQEMFCNDDYRYRYFAYQAQQTKSHN
jgi:hypothetical protein